MDTRETLLEHATELIRTRGYSGFSYADLAERVGIRKASIHHHFPAKEDLGIALVNQYIEIFGAALEEIRRQNPTAPDALAAYAQLYRSSLNQGWACLCGMLASEVEIVPESVALGVRRFMSQNLQWLAVVIESGVQERHLVVSGEAREHAANYLALCQGALLLSRAMQTPEHFEQAIQVGLATFTRH